MTPQAINIVFELVGLFVIIGTAAWALSTKLERLKTLLEGHSTLMNERMKQIDKDIIEVKDAIKESRHGRVQIWGEINNLRERATVLETKLDS